MSTTAALPRLSMPGDVRSRKRPSRSPTDLPLKKRHVPSVSNHSPPPNPPILPSTSDTLVSSDSLLSPVDFSLPNRSRAKISPSKCSHTDTDSPTSEHSVDAPRPLDLSTDKSPVKPGAGLPTPLSSLALWEAASQSGPALLNTSLVNPLMNPFLSTAAALNPDLLKLLLGGAGGALSAQSLPSSLNPEATTSQPPPPDPETSEESKVINPATGNKVRRNYKNMTRERRMEANARERTRVHTIGAAFDSLQRLVPSLAPDQKLSKLSILRIGCKYILLLAAMSGRDYSLGQEGYSVQECLEMLNETIVQESKVRRVERR